MNTIFTPTPENSRRQRRNYTDEFKDQVIAICSQPGMSVAFVARKHDINSNLLHRWVREREKSTEPRVKSPHWNAKESKPLFLPVQIPERVDSPVNESVVKIEILRGKAVVSLEWPVSQIALSASLIKELMT